MFFNLINERTTNIKALHIFCISKLPHIIICQSIQTYAQCNRTLLTLTSNTLFFAGKSFMKKFYLSIVVVLAVILSFYFYLISYSVKFRSQGLYY